jgi:hypothetical protein
MAKRSRNEGAWKNAKKICHLNDKQIEMAQALGMNPGKLPRLRPGRHQGWKLPVGLFIEECYRKRFQSHGFDDDPALDEAMASAGNIPAPQDKAHIARHQVEDLACYCINLSDDLQKWLEYGSIDPEVLAEVREELGKITAALETGSLIYPFPSITLPPQPARSKVSRQLYRGRRVDDDCPDDEIPF